MNLLRSHHNQANAALGAFGVIAYELVGDYAISGHAGAMSGHNDAIRQLDLADAVGREE